MNQQNISQTQITVTVTQANKKEGHYFYTIIGTDKNGQFNIERRYSNFGEVKSAMQKRWPGCYVPSLPEKRLIGNQDFSFIELRKQGLNLFLNSLKDIQHLWYSEQFQFFLRKMGETQKTYQKLKQPNTLQILNRYKEVFSPYLNKQITKQLNNELIEFNQYLRKAVILLQNLQKRTEKAEVAHKRFNQKYLELIQVMIPKYQRKCMKVYMDQNSIQEPILIGPKKQKLQEITQQMKKIKNSVTFILELIKRERRQIVELEEVLSVKEEYSRKKQKIISKIKDLQIQGTKIHAGKQSFFSKLSNKSKQNQLKQNQLHIKKAQQQQQNLALLCELITVLLEYRQISRFKSIRQKQYYQALRRCFQIERQQNDIRRSFWQLVLKSDTPEEEVQNFFQSQKQEKQLDQQITQKQNALDQMQRKKSLRQKYQSSEQQVQKKHQQEKHDQMHKQNNQDEIATIPKKQQAEEIKSSDQQTQKVNKQQTQVHDIE